MRIAQILHGKTHWIFEAEEIPSWPSYPDGSLPLLVDITDRPEIKEGWNYNPETGEFTEPIPSEPIEPIIELPTIEEQIYAETLYQTALLEIQILGGGE